MALTIMTNELALAAQRNLANTEVRLNSTIQKLASGSRIVRAADDPAGLAISDNMNATIRSLGQAMRNAQDGISLIQVFEGGTTEINNMLVRMRELSIQSASDTVGDRERAMLNNEVQELKQEVTRIAKTTNFAGKDLLSGDRIHLEFQVGPNNDPEKDRVIFDPGASDLTLKAWASMASMSPTRKTPRKAWKRSIPRSTTSTSCARASGLLRTACRRP